MILSGAHVLVTGASRGIGAAIAAGAAARGARVTLLARTPLDERAASLGGHALAVDLSDRAARADVVARAEAQAGQALDVLVNCAGLDNLGGLLEALDVRRPVIGGLLEVGAEQMAELFEVNLLAPCELTRQALPGLVARDRGHLVDVSSGFSAVSAPGLVPYAASKAGMSHFHGGVRTELRGTAVGTTLVEPGPVQTGMWDGIVAQGLASGAMRRFQQMRLAKLSEPAEVAEATLDAVEAGRRHVVLPRRMTPVMALGWIPRRVSDLALTGVPRR